MNSLRFLKTASTAERRVLVASTLGWMLDGMDVTLYSMVIIEVEREFRLSSSQAGLLASLTLIASAIGGVLFGIFADRFGRRAALIASISMYSIFTGACGLTRSVEQLAVFRFLLGLGMGGEWATGAALVAETWKPEHRAKALGLMQSGFAIGIALAAMCRALLLPLGGWRSVFFVGILPALLTLWIRRGVPESPLWAAGIARANSRLWPAGATAIPASSSFPPRLSPDQIGTTEASLQPESSARHQFFARPSFYARMIALTLVINSSALFAWWGLFTWIPPFLALPAAQGGRGLTVAASSLWIIVMQAGMWLGYVSFGYLADAFGRRRTYVGYLLLAATLVPIYAAARAPLTLLLVGPLVAFFGTGHFTGFGIITAEIFPTSFRASAMGLTYNFGRAVSAFAPYAVGALAERAGLASAFWISGLAFLIASLAALAIPETYGRMA